MENVSLLISITFQLRPDRTSPLSVARQNEQEFVVESINSHQGNRNRRSTMEFKVRWTGFGSHATVENPTRL